MRYNKFVVASKTTAAKGLTPIKLDKKHLGEVIALVGKNGAGKSRVLELVESYHRLVNSENIVDEYITNIPKVLRNNAHYDRLKISIESLRLQPDNPTVRNGAKQLAKSTVDNIQAKGHLFVLRIDQKDFLNFKKKTGGNLNFSQFINGQRSIDQMIKSLNSESIFAFLENVTTDVFAKNAEAYSRQMKKPSKKTTDRKETVEDQYIERFQYLVKEFLGISFDYEPRIDGRTIGSTLLFDGNPIIFENLSPGQKTLLAYATMLFLIEFNSGIPLNECVIIVDEPEVHLHAEAQIKMVNALRNIVKDSGQLWIATHSLPIITQLSYEEILLVKDNNILNPSIDNHDKSFEEIVGTSNNLEQIKDFLISNHLRTFNEFTLQCFKEPETIFSIDTSDPQYELFKNAIINNNNIELLDFGAGKGRLGHTLNNDLHTTKKISYSALDIQPPEELNKVPNIKRVETSLDKLKNEEFDAIVVCNVLHEISPTDWTTQLNKLGNKLKNDGILIIIEDLHLPKGETAHKYGYNILDNKGIELLFGTDSILHLRHKNKRYSERLVCSIIPKKQVKTDISKIMDAIKHIYESTWEQIKTIKEESRKDARMGRHLANLTHQHLNAKHFLLDNYTEPMYEIH